MCISHVPKCFQFLFAKSLESDNNLCNYDAHRQSQSSNLTLHKLVTQGGWKKKPSLQWIKKKQLSIAVITYVNCHLRKGGEENRGIFQTRESLQIRHQKAKIPQICVTIEFVENHQPGTRTKHLPGYTANPFCRKMSHLQSNLYHSQRLKSSKTWSISFVVDVMQPMARCDTNLLEGCVWYLLKTWLLGSLDIHNNSLHNEWWSQSTRCSLKFCCSSYKQRRFSWSTKLSFLPAYRHMFRVPWTNCDKKLI